MIENRMFGSCARCGAFTRLTGHRCLPRAYGGTGKSQPYWLIRGEVEKALRRAEDECIEGPQLHV